MLVTSANPCGGMAGLFVFRRIFRQRARLTRITSLSNSNDRNTLFTVPPAPVAARASKTFRCGARRRVRDDGGEGDGDDESYGYNEEIAMLELYSQSCREEALIVTAIVDDEEVEVLIFKGFSSCLSGETAVDPARSVLPERAVIKQIDRVKGPFDPSQIHYIRKGLSFDAFKETMITQT
ncbi:hypothetical protein EUTSA_v10004999mg [Eutrema salsugineum]|uniref:DUF7734 domain-containing protein n=1 Tax=Eutrema salsugineum TaxID=72664 RepID=V4KPC4_EUTSA|nr:uncharacterized protein LOC18013151 [Eutrema salsugineum]ESQ33139.1 hypothetical protein EUTSA_v10004999mg [Eutrema salsugineum]